MPKDHVILVNPSFVFDNEKSRRLKYNDFPLNLGLLASILIAKGYSAEIINANIHPDWESRVLHSLRREDIAFVGFTCMSSQVESTIKLCKTIRRDFPSVHIVLGGVHPTLVPESLIRTGLVDVCVVGEGDVAVVKIIEYINGGLAIEDVPNIAAIGQDGKITKTASAPQTDFSGLPCSINPTLYKEDIEKYVIAGPVKGFPILTALGCKFQCAFCINNITKRRYRSKPAPAILEEMRYLKQEHDIRFFVFQDEHFFGDKPRLYELLQLIEDDKDLFGNINWTTTVRVTDFKEDYLNVPLLKRIVRSGCVGLGTGGESGSDRMLKALRKGTSREDILRAGRYSTEAGLRLSYSFVMLWPSETMEEMRETSVIIDTILRMGPCTHVPYFQTYRPYPGSIWEPDLTRFEDPENIPSDTWRMQLLDKKRLDAFEKPGLLYNLILITQVMTLVGDPIWHSAMPAGLKKMLYALCSFRVRHDFLGFLLEKPLLHYIQRRHTNF